MVMPLCTDGVQDMFKPYKVTKITMKKWHNSMDDRWMHKYFVIVVGLWGICEGVQSNSTRDTTTVLGRDCVRGQKTWITFQYYIQVDYLFVT